MLNPHRWWWMRMPISNLMAFCRSTFGFELVSGKMWVELKIYVGIVLNFTIIINLSFYITLIERSDHLSGVHIFAHFVNCFYGSISCLSTAVFIIFIYLDMQTITETYQLAYFIRHTFDNSSNLSGKKWLMEKSKTPLNIPQNAKVIVWIGPLQIHESNWHSPSTFKLIHYCGNGEKIFISILKMGFWVNHKIKTLTVLWANFTL